jgi:hypothetical protein
MTFFSKLRGAAVAAGVTLGLGLGLPVTEAHAQTFIPCSSGRTAALNAAIVAANNNPGTRRDIILQAGCVYGVSTPFDGDNGLTGITGNVRISSTSTSTNAIIARSATAVDQFRIFEVEDGGQLSLNRITVRNGAAFLGGGILNGGTLTLTSSTLAENTADQFGGGLYNFATATLNSSTVRDQSANDGAGVFNTGTLTVNGGRIATNDATEHGGGIYNATLNGLAGVTRLVGTTITGNTASDGGGIWNDATVTNTGSSITNNTPNNCAGSQPVPGCVG